LYQSDHEDLLKKLYHMKIITIWQNTKVYYQTKPKIHIAIRRI